MNKEQNQETEVVKIRLGSSDKTKMQEIAEAEFRTFSDLCRLAIHEWLEAKAKRPAR